MSTNTGLLIGFGLLGLLYFTAFDTEVKPNVSSKTKPVKPKNQPKKIIL